MSPEQLINSPQFRDRNIKEVDLIPQGKIEEQVLKVADLKPGSQSLSEVLQSFSNNEESGMYQIKNRNSNKQGSQEELQAKRGRSHTKHIVSFCKNQATYKGQQILIVRIRDVKDQLAINQNIKKLQGQNKQNLQINTNLSITLQDLNKQMIELKTIIDQRLSVRAYACRCTGQFESISKKVIKMKANILDMDLNICHFGESVNLSLNQFQKKSLTSHPLGILDSGIDYCMRRNNSRTSKYSHKLAPDLKLYEPLLGDGTVSYDESRIKLILFRLLQNSFNRMPTGKMLIQCCYLPGDSLLEIKSDSFQNYFTNSQSNLNCEKHYLIYIITDRGIMLSNYSQVNDLDTNVTAGKNSNQHNDPNSQSFHHFQSILNKIKSFLWVQTSHRGTSFLIATPAESVSLPEQKESQRQIIDQVLQDLEFYLSSFELRQGTQLASFETSNLDDVENVNILRTSEIPPEVNNNLLIELPLSNQTGNDENEDVDNFIQQMRRQPSSDWSEESIINVNYD